MMGCQDVSKNGCSCNHIGKDVSGEIQGDIVFSNERCGDEFLSFSDAMSLRIENTHVSY